MNIAKGVNILQENDRIDTADSLEKAISDLITEWQGSKFAINQ